MSPNDVWITLTNSFVDDFQKDGNQIEIEQLLCKTKYVSIRFTRKVWNYTCMDIDFDKIELMDGSKHTEQVKRTISINLLGNLSLLDF